MKIGAAALAFFLFLASALPLFAGGEEREDTPARYGVGRVTVREETVQEEEDATPEEVREPLIYLRDAGCPDYDAEIEAIAKTMWGEARGVGSKTEIAAVGWCILNRVDSPDFPDTVLEVCAQKNQFHGYRAYYPVTDELRGLAADVITRWVREREGDADAGRVLPAEYLYFVGDGIHNYFTAEFLGSDVWDWRLSSPYED